jgi:uracil-DNA glycosylase
MKDPVAPAEWLQRAIDRESDWAQVREAALGCQACELWKCGTQTVFGEGPPLRPRSPRHPSPIMLIGEQPGDQEDRSGHPFVGPAGRLLDRALAEAGIDRARVYVTNAVKHFKWKPQGKRRIHEKPSANEVRSCRPWLEAELALIEPDVVVLLGATAAQSLLGPSFRVTRERGKPRSAPFAPHVVATVHPSALLRQADPRQREIDVARFVADLRVAAEIR